MKSLFVVAITTFLLGWLARQANKAKGRQVAGQWLFPPIPALRILYTFLLALGLWLLVAGFGGPTEDRALVMSGGALFEVFAAVTWPKQVVVTSEGLRQRSWRGAWKRISWNNVTHSEEKKDGSVVILGEQTKIVFSQYHAGKKLFLDQLKQHHDLFVTP